MNLFENQNYYSKEEFDKISYHDQKRLFLKIREWVPKVDERYRYNKQLYKSIIIKKIEQICAYACAGHIPSQDYMGYIYKRGFPDVFPINFKRSLEWDIIAARNGSKIAPEKMRAFMNPAVNMILSSERGRQIILYNDLNYENYFLFLSQYVCDLLYADLGLDPVEMSKKDLIEQDTDKRKTLVFMDRFRDRCVEKAIRQLVEKLPEDMPDDDEDDEVDKVADEILSADKLPPEAEVDFSDIDIEDID